MKVRSALTHALSEQTQLPELQELGTLERLRGHFGCHLVCAEMANGDRSVFQVIVNPKISNFDMARSFIYRRHDYHGERIAIQQIL